MKVLMLSIDQRIFQSGSDVQNRMIAYGGLVEELHIIVHASSGEGFGMKRIGENVFLYPTNTFLKPLYFQSAYRIAKSILNKEFIISTQEGLTSLLGSRIKKRFGLKLEIQIHADVFGKVYRWESIRNYIDYLAYRFALRSADCVRVVSERIKNSIERITNAPINVLPVWVDVVNIENTKPSFDLHEKYPKFKKIILVVSRLTKEKRIQDAIDALKTIPNVGLVIVGDGAEKNSLKSKIKNQKLEHRVFFEGWQNDTASYFKTADVYLLTSSHEGYGRTLIEAAAADCPIVTTNVGLVGGILHDKESALVCAPLCTPCLADNIKCILEDEVLAKGLAHKAKNSLSRAILRDFDAYLGALKHNWDLCVTSR